MRFVLITLGIFMTSVAIANTDWINTNPNHTSKNYLYKGYGSAKELSIAIENARSSAVEEAIRELYGTAIKIDTKSYETSKDSQLIKRHGEVSQSIQVNDFKLSKIHKEYSNGQFIVTGLFQYPKESVNQERERLSQLDKDLEVQLIAIKSEDKKKSMALLLIVVTLLQ